MIVVMGLSGMPFAYDDIGSGIVFRTQIEEAERVLVLPTYVATDVTGQINALFPLGEDLGEMDAGQPEVMSSDARSAGTSDTATRIEVDRDSGAILHATMKDGTRLDLVVPEFLIGRLRAALSKAFLRGDATSIAIQR